jgi:hypothetical protein
MRVFTHTFDESEPDRRVILSDRHPEQLLLMGSAKIFHGGRILETRRRYAVAGKQLCRRLLDPL